MESELLWVFDYRAVPATVTGLAGYNIFRVIPGVDPATVVIRLDNWVAWAASRCDAKQMCDALNKLPQTVM